ncbi:putative retrotransposon hot spot protein (RHS) [Trypanosoma cruzi]|uniref:Putative retrotransposon hot spot protein (RHS) n=1 Tax=Trypanosoma cruzi TaxID=5693 RepID=A0A2V2VYJ4_TRYCR|nr:putative retrotransposon hot spot protein (RHS) [Trypanosoma cruzi]
MVLTSDKGWPYSWEEDESTPDCYVNCEVDRVWRIVRNDLTEWFSPHLGPTLRLGACVDWDARDWEILAAGSYLLYQLLHCDAKKLQVVVYSFDGSTTYVFDKTIKTVTRYVGRGASKEFLCDLWDCGMKGMLFTMWQRKEHRQRNIFCLAPDGV